MEAEAARLSAGAQQVKGLEKMSKTSDRPCDEARKFATGLLNALGKDFPHLSKFLKDSELKFREYAEEMRKQSKQGTGSRQSGCCGSRPGKPTGASGRG